MDTPILRYVGIPTFEDEDKMRTAKLLGATLFIVSAVAVLRVVLAYLFGAPEYFRALIQANSTIVITVGALYFIVKQGHVKTAAILFTIYQWLAFALITLQYGGVTISSYSFFIFVIFAAGLLINGWWSAGFTVLTIVFGLVAVRLENVGILTPTLETSFSAFNTITPSFVTTAVLVYLYRRDTERALDRSRAATVQLAQINEQLSQEISAREAAEERLIQAQKMEAIGRLSGGIAHDLNNFLVPIMGYADLAMQSVPDDSKTYWNLTRVKGAAERAADLTRQILAFSRQQVLIMEVLALNEVVKTFREIVRPLIPENIELKLTLSPLESRLLGDRTQIEQVLMNLVLNARDAMPDGGTLEIETEIEIIERIDYQGETIESGEYAILYVRDCGVGMDLETQKHIFEPFYTTKGRTQGTGLGMATVFGIVKQHHGYIHFMSELGVGTEFKIYLPTTDQRPSRSGPRPAVEPSAHESAVILVVEDEEPVRRLVCDSLIEQGYTVLECADPEAALDAARMASDPISLLLTDVMMPGMNGVELFRELQTEKGELICLYMSGYSDEVIAQLGLPDTAVNFLQKPFAVSQLTAKVQECLQNAGSRLVDRPADRNKSEPLI